MPTAYHYTTEYHLRRILSDGVISLESGVTLGKDKPCVWFTTNETWEPTCFKQVNGQDVHDPIELAKAFGGLARIGIDTRKKFIRTIEQWRKESGCIPAIQHILIDVTAEQFNVNPERDWRVSFRPVHKGYWQGIETSSNGVDWEKV